MSATKQYYNYTIIDAERLIEKVNVDVINYYFENGIPLVKINRDFKKVFVHFLIKGLCERCLNQKSGPEKILFCNPNLISSTSEIFDTLDYSTYIKFVEGVLKEIEGLIPVAVYNSADMEYADISEKASTNDLKYNFDYIYAKSQGKKSLRKLSQYAEDLGLNFIHRDYLTQLSLRKIFI
jgi:hypothetical protein